MRRILTLLALEPRILAASVSATATSTVVFADHNDPYVSANLIVFTWQEELIDDSVLVSVRATSDKLIEQVEVALSVNGNRTILDASLDAYDAVFAELWVEPGSTVSLGLGGTRSMLADYGHAATRVVGEFNASHNDKFADVEHLFADQQELGSAYAESLDTDENGRVTFEDALLAVEVGALQQALGIVNYLAYDRA